MNGGRECLFYLATDGYWYLKFGRTERSVEDHDCDHFGPFPTEKRAKEFMFLSLTMPGGCRTDSSGKTEPHPEAMLPEVEWTTPAPVVYTTTKPDNSAIYMKQRDWLRSRFVNETAHGAKVDRAMKAIENGENP